MSRKWGKKTVEAKEKMEQFWKKGRQSCDYSRNTHTYTHSLSCLDVQRRERTLKWIKLANAWMHTKTISLRVFFFFVSLDMFHAKKASLNYSYVSVSMYVNNLFTSICFVRSSIHIFSCSFGRSFACSRVHSPGSSNFNYFLKSFVCMCYKFTYTRISGWSKNKGDGEVAWHL